MSGYGGRFPKGKVIAFVLTGFGTHQAAIPIKTFSLKAERPQPEANNPYPSCAEIDLLPVLVSRFIDLNLFKIDFALLAHMGRVTQSV